MTHTVYLCLRISIFLLYMHTCIFITAQFLPLFFNNHIVMVQMIKVV